MTRANDSWFRRRLFHSRNLTAFPLIALLPLCIGAGMLTRAQEPSKDPQIAAQSGNQKSEVLAPGIEHIQFTRGYKSDKEATGPWFINMLRLPGSVAPYFEQRLREKLPTKADRVLNRIRDARGGKLNSSVFGERMRGKGQHWEAQEQLFNVFCKRLGFNEHRVGSDRHERVSTFRRPIAQGSLFA